MKRRVLALSIALSFAAAARGQGVVTIAPSQDASIYSEFGGLANGAGQYLFAGMNAQGFVRRALLRFDVASAIPPGATVTHAELVLHLSNQSSASEIVSLWWVTSGWGEGPTDPPGAEGAGATAANGDVTWTDRYFGQGLPWSTPGGDLFSFELASRPIDGIADWSFASAQLTAVVDEWAQQPGQNLGLCVRCNETVAGTAKRFDSRESPTPALRPRLVVTWSMCTPPSVACVGTPNSTGVGARLALVGAPSIFANDFALHVYNAPFSTNGTFFFGNALTSVPYGDGLRCAGGTLFRFGTVSTDASGEATRALDFTTYPGSTLAVGQQRWFQFAYRDIAAGGAGFNASDTLAVTICP